MTRQLAFALGIALVLPALAQEQAYEYRDDGSGWTAPSGGGKTIPSRFARFAGASRDLPYSGS